MSVSTKIAEFLAGEADYDVLELLREARRELGQPTPPAGDVEALVEYIAEQWDGCEYDTVGERIDIGHAIRQAAARRLASAPREQGVGSPAGFSNCPITGRKFFQNIDHPRLGLVATYGGPFDSYTIPRLDKQDYELRCERYDHDADRWVEGGEPFGYFYYEQQPIAPAVVVDEDGELFRYLEKHVAGWHSYNAPLPRFVFKPRWRDKDGYVCSLLVTGRDGVGTVSLRTALRIIREQTAALGQGVGRG